MDFFTAQEWIDDMNIRRYAGYSDWRLPTVEEVVTLIEIKKTNGGMRIDPLFSKLQSIIWTGDGHYPGRSFFINFYSAVFGTNLKIFNKCWVRPVRSMKHLIRLTENDVEDRHPVWKPVR